MEWSCGSGAATVARANGYVMDLAAMGCGVEQKLIMRVMNSPNRIHWELYGTGHVVLVWPTLDAE